MTDLLDLTRAERGTAEWWLPRLEKRLIGRQAEMKLYHDYYHGRHRMTFHTARILKAFGETFRDVRSNYCAVVIDALVERLTLEGFRFGKDEGAATAAWDIWQANGLDASFPRALRSGLIKGEASFIVWADADGEPTISIEDGSQVYVALDPADPRVRRAAIKVWKDEDQARQYATVYLADGIYKFQSPLEQPIALPGLGGPSRWEKRIVEGEDWPLANPLDLVPVVPLPNKPDPSGVGESEIVAIVPVQDALNANLVNVLLGGQYGAFRQKFATNVRLEIDEATGKPKEPWQVDIASIMTAPPPEAGEQETKFGEFGQTDLTGYVGVHESLVQAVSTISRTPPHYFLGQQGVFPSGEALRAVEAGLTFKARDRIRDDSEPIEEVMRLAFEVKSRRSGESSSAVARYKKWAAMKDAEALWRDPETKTESEHIDALGKIAQMLGVPKEALWPRIPASPQEIERWKEMAKAAAPAPAMAEPDEFEVDRGDGAPPVVIRSRRGAATAPPGASA